MKTEKTQARVSGTLDPIVRRSGWRFDDAIDSMDTKPFLAVLRGPKGGRWQAVLEYDDEGYLLQPSPTGPVMISAATEIEAWRPLPRYSPNTRARSGGDYSTRGKNKMMNQLCRKKGDNRE